MQIFLILNLLNFFSSIFNWRKVTKISHLNQASHLNKVEKNEEIVKNVT